MATIDIGSWRRIGDAVRWREQTYRNHRPGSSTPAQVILPNYLGITVSAIPGRVGKSPGSGTVQRYVFNGTLFVIAPGESIAVFNWSGTTIPGNVWVEYHPIDGYQFVNGSDCSGVAP